ncbi:MAG: SNF2-related protein [Chitinophagales bacterium]
MPTITKKNLSSELLEYIQRHANSSSLSRGQAYMRQRKCKLLKYDEEKGQAKYEVRGSSLYTVNIKNLNTDVETSCNCPYDFGGICKHQVAAVLDFVNKAKNLDALLEKKKQTVPKRKSINPIQYKDYSSLENMLKDQFRYFEPTGSIFVEHIEAGKAVFTVEERTGSWYSPIKEVTVAFSFNKKNELQSVCSCDTYVNTYCKHEKTVIYALKDSAKNDNLFELVKDPNPLREEVKEQYGVNNDKQIDIDFELELENGVLQYSPIDDSILKRSKYMDWDGFHIQSFVNRADSDILKTCIVPEKEGAKAQKQTAFGYALEFFDENSLIPLYIHPLEGKVSKSNDKLISGIKQIYHFPKTEIASLQIKVTNIQETTPYNHHNPDTKQWFKSTLELYPLLEDAFEVLENEICYQLKPNQEIRKSNLSLIRIRSERPRLCFELSEDQNYYIFKAFIKIGERLIDLEKDYVNKPFPTVFFTQNQEVYLFPNVEMALAFNYFKVNAVFKFQKEDIADFLQNMIIPLSENYPIRFNVKSDLFAMETAQKSSKRIYLSELSEYILFKPVLDYGQKEVDVFHQGDAFFKDEKDKLKKLDRDFEEENFLMDFLLDAHESFRKRKHRDIFYLSVDEMTESGWFFNFFKQAKENEVEVFGFDKLKNFKYNVNKAKVNVSVKSNIDWFDTKIDVSFGDQVVDLSSLKKAVVNKQNYVKLGDGSIGILPEKWLDKLERYFRIGQVKKDGVQVSKLHFSVVDEYFDQIDDISVKQEIEEKKTALLDFEKVENLKLPVGVKAQLRDYQQSGYNWLGFLQKFSFGGCLADDMGLGKTLQVLTLLMQQKNEKKTCSLVVVPRSLIFNWQAEADKFCPKLKYFVHHGTKRQSDTKNFKKYDFILTTYGTAAGDIELLKDYRFNYIVLDESQAIKNPRSKRFKAMRLLQGANRLALTGTPVENNTFDLYAQMQFLNPGFLGSESDFKKNYSDPIDKDKNEKRAVELRNLINPFILRRTKEQVATELPEKTESVIYCDMDKSQRKIYDVMRNKYRNYVMGKIEEDGLNKSRMYVLEGLTKLRQVCNSPALISGDEVYENVSIKLDTLKEHILDKTGNHKVLVFSQFVKMLGLIKNTLDEAGIQYAYLDGATQKREEQVDYFQNDNDCRVFLISLKAGGTGLNLTAADYVYIVDPWWNPAVEAQAIDRCYRIGQDKHVFSYKMICKDTVEEKILDLQKHKLKLSSDLIKTDDAVFKKLEQKDIAALFD